MEKILLIDDDEDLLISLTEYLENSHYVVITAKNGKEGLDLLEKFFDNISLVITDVRMPIIGGVEVCRKIRSIDKFKNLPILILTTMTDISDKYIGFTSGANDYLTKPFEPLELLLRIQSLLNRNIFKEESNEDNNLSLTMNRSKHTVTVRNIDLHLRPLEFDILFYLYSNPDRLVSVEELFLNVFKYPPETGNPDTIRAHIKNIRNKVEIIPNEPKIVTNIPKKGYVFNSKV